MGKISNGIKAGALGGLVFGIISAIFIVLALVVFREQVLSALQNYMTTHPIYAQNGYTAQKLYNAFMVSEPVFYSIIAIILGLILGIVFASVHERLPGKNPFLKGLIFGIILWLIIGLFLNRGNLYQYGTSYFGITVTGFLVGSLVYSYLLGYLFNRFENSSKMMISEPGRRS